MNNRLILIIIFLLICPLSAFCLGQEGEGQALEKAGKSREALTRYVSALGEVSEGSADEQRLREKIIGVVQKLDPQPAIPEETKRFMVRGQTLFKDAQNKIDYDEAAAEFEKALRIAPWFPAAYFNLGLACEGAQEYDKAISSFKFYLLALPAAQDAESVKEKIYSLEVKQEKAQRKAAVKGKTPVETAVKPEQLVGMWRDQNQTKVIIAISGNQINIRRPNHNLTNEWFEGTIEGLTISGFRLQDFSWCKNGRILKDAMTGTISEDGFTISLTSGGVGPSEIGTGDMITKWFQYKDNRILTRE